MIRSVIVVFVAILLPFVLFGCRKKEGASLETHNQPTIIIENGVSKDDLDDVEVEPEETIATEDAKDEEVNTENEPEILVFRDVFGQEYQTEINQQIPSNPYSANSFKHDGDKLVYDDDNYKYVLGVDVSHHQNSIDWKSVREEGYDFTFLRIAYRGYGKAGSLNPDRTFEQNYKSAKSNGLSVGVYFFAQAINEKEAEEEAEYVLNILNGRELELPVVYDPESILDDEARTDNVTSEQFTKNTRVFCDIIREAGYKPMIYSNMLWEAFQLDLTKLSDIPIWYADYEDVPQTPYNFEFWQYSNEGHVKGISGVTDLNIWLKPNEE